MQSSRCSINVSTLSSILVSPLPSSFHSMSMSSLECKTLYLFISFLVLWSILWSSFFVHLKNSPKYLTRRTAHYYYYYYLRGFSCASLIGVSLLKSELPQISSGIRETSSYLNWSEECCCLEDHSSSSSIPSIFFRPLGPLPRAPTTILITLTLMFHNNFNTVEKCKNMFVY